MQTLWQDVRYAFRMLAKNPGFTAAAVLTLALGIGANTAIFSLTNAVLFRPLPLVRQPSDLAYLSHSYSYPDFESIREHSTSFAGMFAQSGTISLNLNVAGEPELVTGELVTANFFEVLGVGPALGRTFLAEEDRRPGAHPALVISHGLWQRRFGSDPGVIGKKVSLNGLPFVIVGVMPREFIGDEVGKQRDLWAPMMMQVQLAPFNGRGGPDALVNRDFVWLNVVGRLRPGMGLEQAQAEVNQIRQQPEPPSPEPAFQQSVQLYRVAGGTDPRERSDFLPLAALLLTVVVLLLLTACSNVANLLLARASERQREIGVRIALGATRSRLLRQLLLESLLLALLAGSAGLLLAVWAVNLLSVLHLPGGLTITLDLRLDFRVLLYALATSLLVTLLFGLMPALHATRGEVLSALKQESPVQGVRRSRLRNLFVVAQVTLSMLLVSCAGLFLRSLAAAERIEPGFSTDRAVLLPLNFALAGHSEQSAREVYRQILERLELLPGVRSASSMQIVPLGDSRGGAVVSREGAEPRSHDAEMMTGYNVVGPRYCETMGIPLLAGRDFARIDAGNAPPVAIVNRTLAQRLWPEQNPIGKRLLLGGLKGEPLEIVGVAADAKYESLGERAMPFLYRPIGQSHVQAMTLVVRTSVDPAGLLRAVKEQVRAIDPNLAVFPAVTFAARVRDSLNPARAGAILLGSMGVLGLGLAALGIFGVVAYSVGRRTREIGIRVALGARPADVVRLFVKEGLRMVSVGVGLGLGIGLLAAQLLSRFLYGIRTSDAPTFVGTVAVLAGAAILACWLPARRATRVDPLAALRYE